ncbi:MAG: hypothetical protein R3211_07600 [Balneolaceae bacterium]|nr:hypothetical protein [Balneolaceae bacterium]
MRKFMIPAILSVFLTSCVSSSVTQLDRNQKYPAVHPDSVQVFLTAGDVPCRYEKVALIKTKADHNIKEDKSVKKARKDAGKIGANAIILERMKDPTTGAKVANVILGTGANTKGEMLAIYIDNRACVEKQMGSN